MGTLLAIGFAARGRTVASARLRVSRTDHSRSHALLHVQSRCMGRARGWLGCCCGDGSPSSAADCHDRSRSVRLSRSQLWFCAREPDLNRRAAALGGAVSEGRRLAFILFGLTAAAAFVGPAFDSRSGRSSDRPSRRARFGGLLVVAFLVAVGVGACALRRTRNTSRVAPTTHSRLVRSAFRTRAISTSGFSVFPGADALRSGVSRSTTIARIRGSVLGPEPTSCPGCTTDRRAPGRSATHTTSTSRSRRTRAGRTRVAPARVLRPDFRRGQGAPPPARPDRARGLCRFPHPRRGRLGLGDACADDRRPALRRRDHGRRAVQSRGTTR